MTEWALGLISTVRIGAGAGHSPGTQTAATPISISHATNFGKTRKGNFEVQLLNALSLQKLATVPLSVPPLPRATPLHSVALRAFSSNKKLLATPTAILTTLIGAAAHG
jgi:hypothetical protein